MLEEEKKLTEDRFLALALGRLRENYFTKRAKIESLFDIEGLKERVRSVKERNIETMEENLSEFIERAREVAEDVVIAKDKNQALAAIEGIIKKEGVKNIIKSKSLTTEEIELNEFLKNKGYSIVETDLGEWLVQINGEKPTHMTAPAIHLSKEKIAEILNGIFNVKLEADPKKLVEFCAKKIRESFLNSDCGIVGANVASAETGRCFILSNEGNIQNVLRKKVVICVTGIDKIVKTDKEALDIVGILPKAATAQITTSYIDVLRKPYGKFYLILLDNNRGRFAKNERYKEILYCIHCGACQNACPVYTTVSGSLFRGKTYAGPVGIIMSYLIEDTKELWNFANMCIGCMACDEICSAKIKIQQLILFIKSEFAPKHLTPKRFIIRYIENRYSLLRLIAFFGHFLFKGELKTGIEKLDKLMGFDYRPLPGLNRSFDQSFKQTKKHCNIYLFSGCSVNFFYNNIGKDALDVAKKLGVELGLIEQKSCCGAPAWYNGERAPTVEAAKINVEFLLGLNADRILFLDPHCAHMVKRDYGLLLGSEKTRKLSEKIDCAGNYFLGLIEDKNIKTKYLGGFISYHHPCHLKRGLNISDRFERFIEETEPNFVRLNDSDRCCGFAGSYSLMHPYISRKLLNEKIENIMVTGTQVLVSACPGCIMQIGGGVKARGINIEILHFVSYLNRIL